ncbi:MAG: glutamine cyclotransferase [Acetobacteraceae bacterium]|nr:glutamine cyclotransferase [Pseudomonadota bacterium]
MTYAAVEIVRELGPFPGVAAVHGVSFDGKRVWIATGDSLAALDPESGTIQHRIHISAQAGTAYDGRYIYQLSGTLIWKIDPTTDRVVATIPAPDGVASGMAWAEGSLWVGQYQARRIHQVDPETGAVLRSIHCSRHVTGVTWVDGQLWHGTWEDDASDLRRIDPQSGAVLQALAMPAGTIVSGLESDGAGVFFCGGGPSGVVRVVRRPD